MKYNDLATAFIAFLIKLFHRTHFKHTWDIECKSQEQRGNDLIDKYVIQYIQNVVEKKKRKLEIIK